MKLRLAVILGMIVFLLVGFFWFQNSILPRSKTQEFKTFVITPGESLEKISKRLQEEGMIKNSLTFRILAAFRGFSKKIQAGSFRLSPTESATQILGDLTRGTFDVWVTIPEGFRLEEIADLMNAKLGIDKEEFMKVAREGLMFPDTYLIPAKASALELSKIMMDNFDKRINQNLANEIKKSGLTLDQVIILASIVEREVKFEKDRPIVAGILIKRWRKGLSLGADATVQYILGYQPAEKSWWKKTITTEDLAINSPYNTRKFTGLPPGPICNPGLSSIEAVADPAKTDFYYYVSDKQGNMHYAQSLDEHIENIKNHL